MIRLFFLTVSLAIFVLGPMTTKAPHITSACATKVCGAPVKP